ncbi:MAG TPA: ROK family transcriptional regulator [Firmicutes bacterium]|nr:ROK family transcriptional regulator [Bacillota bacterium]
MRSATPQSARIQNRRAMLELIEREGSISRVALADFLGLSQPTVSEVVAELVKAGLVLEVGLGSSRGGRRPVMLKFNDEVGYVVAIDLGGTQSRLALFTLGGRQVARDYGVLPRAETPAKTVRLLGDQVRSLISKSAVPYDRVYSVGVAVPGVADPATGEVKLAPALGWQEAPVGSYLSEELGLPVYIDNDVNAAALAELRFGAGRSIPTFVYVWIGTGVGAGLVIDGRLHRGFGNFAGEIGYLVVDTPSPLEGQEGFGQLERRVALSRIVERMVAEGVASPPASEHEYRLAFEGLLAQAEHLEEPATSILNELIETLSRALVNVMLVVAPNVIFLGGPIGSFAERLIPLLEQRMHGLSPIVPVLRVSGLAEEAGLIGAAALASTQAKELLLRRLAT